MDVSSNDYWSLDRNSGLFNTSGKMRADSSSDTDGDCDSNDDNTENTCSDLIATSMSCFGENAMRAATGAMGYFTPSPMFTMLPTWNAAYGASVTVLRTGAYSVPRNIASIRFLTDHGIPMWMPSLPSGISCRSQSEPAGEWYFKVEDVVETELDSFNFILKHNDRPYILYFHGGAFCCCNTGTHRPLLMRIVEETGGILFALDYRRPPEHPFPTPVEDGVDAYMWLLKKIPATRIIFAGDSAGGGLVISTIEAALKQRYPAPAGAILLSPWVDLQDCTSESWTRNEKYDYIIPDLTQLFAESYRGSASWEEVSVTLSSNLHLLPPLHIECGESEVFVDQIVAFADKCHQLGVDVTCMVRPEMVHVFPMLSFSNMPQIEEAFLSMARFVEKVLPLWRTPGGERAATLTGSSLQLDEVTATTLVERESCREGMDTGVHMRGQSLEGTIITGQQQCP